MKTLTSYFDKVVLCNLVERPDRLEFFKGQYEKLFGTCDVEIHTSVLHPLADHLAVAFTKGFDRNYGEFHKGGELSYLHEHYTILKKAYLEGVERLLILEDDICFHRDPEYTFAFLDALPADFDVAHGDYCNTTEDSVKFLNPYLTAWVKHPGVGVWNCSFLALSRKGIEYALSIFAKYAAPADYPYWCSVLYPELATYCSTKPVAIQMSNNDSNISDKSRNMSNYMYTHVDRSRYFDPSEFITPETRNRVVRIAAEFDVIARKYPLKQTLKVSR